MRELTLAARSFLTGSTFWQFVRHIISGFVAAFFDFGILWVLTHFLRVDYRIATAAGFLAGSIVVYVLGALWVFSRGTMSVWQEFLAVFGLNILGLGITEVIMICLVEGIHFPVIASKCVAVVIVTFFNFYMRKKYVFSQA